MQPFYYHFKSKISGMIATNYNPKASEEKWYKYWMDHKLFHSEVDNSREPYCIVIPPPNRRARRTKASCIVLFSMCPMCRTPVTLGGGMTMQ